MSKRIVECVGALIFDDEKKICLQERDDKLEINCPGLWGLFGGTATKNESLEEAVKREVFEELLILPKKVDFSVSKKPGFPRFSLKIPKITT